MKAAFLFMIAVIFSSICYADEHNKCNTLNDFLNSYIDLAQGGMEYSKTNCDKLFPGLASAYSRLILARDSYRLEKQIENDFMECKDGNKITHSELDSYDVRQLGGLILATCKKYYDENEINKMLEANLTPCDRFIMISNKLYTPALSHDETDFMNKVISGSTQGMDECRNDIKRVEEINKILNEALQVISKLKYEIFGQFCRQFAGNIFS